VGADELRSWLRLLLTPGVGPETARRLLAAFGPPESIFSQSPAAWRTVVSGRVAQALSEAPGDLALHLQRAQDWLGESPDHGVFSFADPIFPQELLQMADPPLLLWVQGDVQALHHPVRLAMVGSRNPTPQGQLNARQFARTLSESGVCVVSGLAAGVDGAAHEGALDGGGPTVAVVGTGLDVVYPRRHSELARRIATAGCLISEYLPGTGPHQSHFPRRNRLIAGLTQGTLVVEAAVQSGSLITARLAAELGREVFAIPGSIHSPQAKGCHALIRQGAKLVESAQDVLEDLRLVPATAPREPLASGDEASAGEADPDGLLQALGHDPVSFDALQARTGIDTATLQARLLDLELEGQIARLPGGLLQRLARA
jgi:DNA processing protein